MDLDEIKEFTHPIRKLNVYNSNRYSLRQRIVLKVNPQKQPDETVRFSLSRNGNFIDHQQKDNDFFIRVPNNYIGSGSDTNVADNGNVVITTIYVHYFPKDLYEYTNDPRTFQVFSEYDLYKIADINQEQRSYQIHFKNYETNKEITNRQMKTKIQRINNATTTTEKKELENEAKQFKPIIQSLFTDGTVKDPNYKNYIHERGYYQGSPLNLTEGNDYSGMTEQGQFPLSSHYRTQNMLYVQHPNLKDVTPSWDYDLSFFSYPYWEVKIHRDELSPLISDGVENTDEDTPLNVFLNYNYLQTSTSYHQHLFGFEDSLEYNNKYYNILEGENINKIDQNFGNDNNYRIIQLSNPYNDKYSIKVPKGKQIPLNLDDIFNDNWSKNICEDYYICNGGNTSLSFSHVEKNKLYSLKYYIYIPGKTNTTYNSCYISVNNNRISDDFLYQDKRLRNQWIYHEVPFTGKETNTINIIGPKDNSNIYFYDIYIEEMVEYSPTVKYSNRGIVITEEDQAIMRPLSNAVESVNNTDNIKKWDSKKRKMPTPYHSVFFLISQEEMIAFDKSMYDLLYFGNRLSTNNDNSKPLRITYDTENYDFCIEDTEGEGRQNNIIKTKNFDLEYNANNGQFTIDMRNTLRYIQGNNNYIEISLFNENEQIVNTGRVKTSIYDTNNFNISCDNISTPRGVCLDPGSTYHEPDINGLVIYDKVNLSQLALNENDEEKLYYMRIVYTNECDNGDEIVDIKPFILEKEQYIITPMIRNTVINTNNVYNFNNNNLPLQIQAKVTNQANRIVDVGYCEIFIDDELKQSTIVDANGIADFYLDLKDEYENGDITPKKRETVKIYYYKKWNVKIGESIFDINNNCSALPAVPIKVQALTYKQNNQNTTLGYENEYRYTNTVQVNKGSAVFIDIDVGNHHGFKLEVQAPNSADNLSQNIETKTDESIVYINHYLDSGIQNNETYYIVTKSIDDQAPNYRETKIPVYFKVVS